MTRSYRSPVRAERAHLTRAHLRDTASAIFARKGYTSTSVREIARSAGLSLDSVTAAGGKAALFVAGFEHALNDGEEAIPVIERPEVAGRWGIDDLETAIGAVIDFLVASNERAGGLWPAYLEGARADPVVAVAYEGKMTQMRAATRAVVESLMIRGLAQPVVDAQTIGDLIWAAAHPEQYQLLVRSAGWPRERFRRWLMTLCLTLLRGEVPAGPVDAMRPPAAEPSPSPSSPEEEIIR